MSLKYDSSFIGQLRNSFRCLVSNCLEMMKFRQKTKFCQASRIDVNQLFISGNPNIIEISVCLQASWDIILNCVESQLLKMIKFGQKTKFSHISRTVVNQ